ncbi:MAG TPA: hypothetical protein VGR43_02715 [Dehalococcoidia bacterium]|jgi:hypothetical protein|nr:hypothetical protein [Dehalococcoidia bacterium]
MFAVVLVLAFEVALAGSSGPRIGDHWHAVYEVFVCGESQPPIAEFPHSSGIHTHGDGILHLHTFTAEGEGRGASVEKFFKNSGGWVDFALAPDGCYIDYSNPLVLRADSAIHPLGQGFAEARAVCDSLPESRFRRVGRSHVPQDGDCIRIILAQE